MPKTIDETEMPAPDTIVNCKNGGPIAAMFFYAAAEQNLGDIAIEHGFKCHFISMEDDNDDLWQKWEDGGGAELLEAWNPPAREGYSLGAKIDTEDGPIAIYIQPGPAQSPQEVTGERQDG